MEKPMPLEKLPAYLKQIRENGSQETSPIVDMGKIVENKPRRRSLAFTTIVCLLLAMSGGLYYSVLSTNNVVLTVNSNNIEEISKIINDNGGKIISLEERENSEYKLKIKAKSIKSIIESLRKNNVDLK